MIDSTWRALLRQRLFVAAAVLGGLLGGCGGGGSGDRDLSITFSYATGAQTDLYDTPDIGPTLAGLEGNTPNCVLASGSTLPPGVTLDASSCRLQGLATATGTFAGSVRLTVGGYDGELSAPYGFSVSAPRIDAATYGQKSFLAGATVPAAHSFSQVGQVQFYRNPRAGDVAFLSVTEGRLPVGMTLELDAGGRVLVTGAPAEVGRRTMQISFTLRRAGFETVSAPVALTVEVTAPSAIANYSACCTAYTGVPYSFAPTIGFVLSGGSTLRFETEIGALPDGLALDPDTGEIRGTPTTGERTNFGVVIRARVLSNGATLASTSSSLSFSPVGVFPTYPVTSLGGTALYQSGTEPPYSVTHGVPAGVAFSIAPGPIYGARAGDTYRYRLVPNRNASYAMPAWLSIDATTGVLSGTRPDGAFGIYEVEITLTRGGAEYRMNQYGSIS